jgi:hypothetical protein
MYMAVLFWAGCRLTWVVQVLYACFACRNNEPLNADDARKGLDATVKALDDLLATVPEDILSRQVFAYSWSYFI